MVYKRYFQIVAAIILLALVFPLPSAASQLPADGGVYVISLSAAGNDIANSVAYSPDGNFLAVGASSGILVFHSQTFSQKLFIETGVWARSVAFSPDGQLIAAGLFDGTARFWRLADGQETRLFSGHAGWVRSLAFSHDGSLLSTVADDGTLRIWDATNGSLKLTIPGLLGARVLSLSPDGQTLAVGLQDATIQLRNIANGNLIKSLEGHTGWVRSLAFSPDGQTLASGGFDAKAILWDVPAGALKSILPDHQSSVLGLSFSPDGKTLASGSVDGTVKLWNVTDGSLLRNLVGHSDFVYSVAYSPDGQTVASGSSDNSVRVWDLTDLTAGDLPQPATPGDCRICHHPRGTNMQPRVIQVKCEACHANGIGTNFCPVFARAPHATSLPLIYAESGLPVGVPVARQNISVLLSYPANGETVYAAGANFAPLFVTGQVDFVGEAKEVLVQLLAFSGDSEQPVLTLETHPSPEGRYAFDLTVNPHGALPASLKPGGADCQACHEDFNSQGNLPNGDIHLVVRAISPENETATDERWFKVDTSNSTMLDVRVLEEGSQQPISGLPVRASTVLYEWRARYARQSTDAQGIAHLNLETPTQASTTYQLTIPDTVMNGYYYSIVEPVAITLAPGESPDGPLTLQVQVKTSHVRGQLNGIKPGEPLDIYAIHLPDGQLTKTQSIGTSFEFRDLPNGEYQLIPDPQAGIRLGFQATPSFVDLTQNPDASVVLELEPLNGKLITGQLVESDGSPLPFGWITTASGRTLLPDPVTGMFTLTTDDSRNQSVTFLVPGYYSQAQVLEVTDESSASYVFTRKPDTVSMPWGQGQVVLPSDSIYTTDADGVELARGWIWGHSKGGGPTSVQVAGMEIELREGSFALQYLPPSGGWLYISKGEAVLRAPGKPELQVRSGEMVTFSEGEAFPPVPYDAVVAALLQPSSEVPVPTTWEPGLTAQVQNRLARFGIGAAQMITFVTYLIVLGILVAFLVRGIYWMWIENKNQ